MSSHSFDAFLERLSSVTPIKNQSQLAKELNVGRAAISLAKQKDAVPSKWILNLASEYKLNSEWLYSGTGSPYSRETSTDREESFGIPQIYPKLDEQGRLLLNPENSLNFAQLTTSFEYNIKTCELAYLFMTGKSMDPEIKDRDLVIIDLEYKEIYIGYIYAVAIDNLITVRQIDKAPGEIILQCENAKYDSLRILDKDLDQIKIIGKVLNTIRRYK